MSIPCPKGPQESLLKDYGLQRATLLIAFFLYSDANCEQAPWGILGVSSPISCPSTAPRTPKRTCSKAIRFATGHIAHCILSLQWCELVERRKQSRHWSLSFKFCDIWFVWAWKPYVSSTVAIYIVAFCIFFPLHFGVLIETCMLHCPGGKVYMENS